jgi:ClpP class serine protease
MKILMIEPSFIDTYAESHKVLSTLEKWDPLLKMKGGWKKVECGDEYADMESAPKGDEMDTPKFGVVVYDIKGFVYKTDLWYYSMEDLLDDISNKDKDPTILSHIICLDSGGGEAANIETVTRFIRNNVQKPVYVHINGWACSAAYYLACGADKIYTSEATDIVGSIGTMVTIDDYAKMLTAMGITRHDIYASQSTEKNKEFKQVLQEKYDAIKANLLDPYNAQFIKTVTELRTITDDGHVLSGKIYMTEAAQEVGLIDGQRTFEQVLEEAIQAGIQFFNQNKIPQMTTINMSAPAISAKLGMNTTEFVSTDGHVSLRAEDFAAIEAALAATATPAPIAAVAAPAPATPSAAVTPSVEESFAQMREELASLKQTIAQQAVLASRGPAIDTPPAPDAKQKLLAEEKELFG